MDVETQHIDGEASLFGGSGVRALGAYHLFQKRVFPAEDTAVESLRLAL